MPFKNLTLNMRILSIWGFVTFPLLFYFQYMLHTIQGTRKDYSAPAGKRMNPGFSVRLLANSSRVGWRRVRARPDAAIRAWATPVPANRPPLASPSSAPPRYLDRPRTPPRCSWSSSRATGSRRAADCRPCVRRPADAAV
jgi:hypothetical protein